LGASPSSSRHADCGVCDQGIEIVTVFPKRGPGDWKTTLHSVRQ
jgi:hypothetical protein